MTCGGTIRSVWVVLALGAGSADLLPAQEEAVGLIVDTFCADLDGGTGGVSVDNDGVVYVADFGTPNDIDVGPDGSFYLNEIAATNGPHTNLAPMVVRRIRAAP